jgi:hypothetical protein
MSPGSSLNQLLQQKRVRLALGAVCVGFTLIGAHQLFDGTNDVDRLRGGGNLLAWGGFAVSALLKAYKRQLPGPNTAINVGRSPAVAAWFMHDARDASPCAGRFRRGEPSNR